MRVIGGKYRGRKLETLPGLDVRPTSDRLRETLFNILSPMISGARFLDLCAGSGAVGVEAASRGVGGVTFVEQSRTACAAIQKNLERLGIAEGALVLNQDAGSALKALDQQRDSFDVIYIDPPYAAGLYDEVMGLISRSELLAQDGVVIVEHRSKEPPESSYDRLVEYRQVKQGQSQLAFYKRQKPEE